MYKLIVLFIIFAVSFLQLDAKTLDSEELIKKARQNVKTIETKDLVELLKKYPNTPIIDVRQRADILKDGGYIKANRVTNIPRGILEFKIADIVNFDDKFIVNCFAGKRSALAALRLKQLGYKNLLYYRGSFKAWRDAGLPVSSLDKYPNSMLYSKVEKMANGVYVSIGQTSPPTYENSNHNNNLGFIVGKKYVLVWNAGGNYLLAKALHEEIKKITSLPIKYVVLENSQSHAILGSSYWKEQGATIVSQEIAKEEIKKRGKEILAKKAKLLKDKILGTKIVLPDRIFKDNMKFDLGDRVVEAKYFGYAHEKSDIVLWLDKEKIVFAGDHAFNQRLLPIFQHTNITNWIEAWDKFAALDAKIVIPGHGDVTNMKVVTKYTIDYIVYLKEQIKKIIEDDGSMNDAYSIDMSAYEHLDTFKELSKQNIATLYKQMEFEQ